jgi:acetyl esterase/lipase
MQANTLIPVDAQVVPLWPAGTLDASAAYRTESDEILPNGLPVVRNVTRPSLTVFLPDPATATGTAVIIAPGGAYHFLAYDHEGLKVARWLNEHGIAAFMLKYRLVHTGDDFPQCVDEHLRDKEQMAFYCGPVYPQITADGCRAVALVREQAAGWGVDPQRVGIMGFSAGGFVTLSTALQYDSASRPDFAAPIYSAPPLEAPIPADAPPLFLLCAADDEMASAVCHEYYGKWKSAGHPIEMHIYAKGGHGFGMNPLGLPVDNWIERFGEWLKSMGF